MKFRFSSFFNNVATLVSGTLIAQIIPVIISPLLTRIYTPSEFGVLALYISLSSIVSIIVSGRYELAIMLPKENKDAVNIVYLCFFIALLVSFLVFLAIVPFKDDIENLLGNNSLSFWLYFTPVSILFNGINQTLNYWLSRNKKYKSMAINKIALASSTALANIVFGVLGFTATGLIAGTIFGQTITTLIQYLRIHRDPTINFRRNVSLAALKSNAYIYRDFPKINSLHAFFDLLQMNGIIFIISKIFNSATLGYYSLTFRILKAPLGVVGSAVSQVYYQKATELHNNGESIHSLQKNVILKLTILSFPCFLLIYFFAPTGFSLIFGPYWREAGEYCRMMVPWMFFNFISSPLSQTFNIIGKQKQAFYIGLFYNAFTFFGFAIASMYFKDILDLLFILSALASILTLLYIYCLFLISRPGKTMI